MNEQKDFFFLIKRIISTKVMRKGSKWTSIDREQNKRKKKESEEHWNKLDVYVL